MYFVCVTVEGDERSQQFSAWRCIQRIWSTSGISCTRWRSADLVYSNWLTRESASLTWCVTLLQLFSLDWPTWPLGTLMLGMRQLSFPCFRLHLMHLMWTVVISDPVALCVCLSVWHVTLPYINGWTDWCRVWGETLGSPRNMRHIQSSHHYITWPLLHFGLQTMQ